MRNFVSLLRGGRGVAAHRRRGTEPRKFRDPRRAWRGLAAAAIAACFGLVPLGELGAAERPILVGEVAASSDQRPELARSLRRALEEELEEVDFGGRRPRQRYVLSATLLELDSVTEEKSVRATCVVSVALRRERGSTLQAVIRGRATAEEARSERESVKALALRAAVHSAVRRLPETVRASER